MNFKTITKAALASMMALSLVACASESSASQTEEESTASAEAQHIIIGISPDYPPYDDLTADGQITGFDYEMGEWLFTWLEENGYNYTHEWKQMSFDTIISSIQADQVDLGISGFTYDSERKVLFSDPYYESAQVVIVNSDSDITSLDDLTGKKIGVQSGTTAESCAAEIEDAEVSAMSDMAIVVESLKGGALDAVILDKPVAENYVANGEYVLLDGTLLDEQNYIIAKEGNDALMDPINEAIAAFLASDDFETIKETYGLN